ncbi:MAG: FAD-dependent oxidoreductase [Candidatus Lokiarchaeota archaeon]
MDYYDFFEVNNLRYVIIGVGSAGTNAAETIRAHDKDGKVTVISDEGVPYYVREHLNRLIEGSESEQDLFEKGYDFFKTIGVNFIGDKVVRVDSSKKAVIMENGVQLQYDKLLIASGGKPIPLNVKGRELDGITTLYSLKDAKYILEQLPNIKNIVFIGGGSIALKVSPILKEMGKNITIVEKMPRILPKMLDRDASLLLEEKVENDGITVLTNEEVVEFSGMNNRIDHVILKSGIKIPADLAITIIGIRPSVDFLKTTDVKVDHGIIVDLFMKTSDNDIYAAGDVARVPDPIESFKALPHPGWGESRDEGKNAGLNMAGKPTKYPGEIRLNRMKFKKYAFISGGYLEKQDGNEIIVESGEEFYKKFIFDRERLVGGIILMKNFDSKKWKKWLKKQLFDENPSLEKKDAIVRTNFHESIS